MHRSSSRCSGSFRMFVLLVVEIGMQGFRHPPAGNVFGSVAGMLTLLRLLLLSTSAFRGLISSLIAPQVPSVVSVDSTAYHLGSLDPHPIVFLGIPRFDKLVASQQDKSHNQEELQKRREG